MFNAHSFNQIVHGKITGIGRVFSLRRIDIPEIIIFGFKIRRPKTEYIVGFCDVTLDNGKKIHDIGERNIKKNKFNSLRVGDRVEIQFDTTQHFTGGPTGLFASNFTCIERQEVLPLS
jgi:hypothetical protein